MTAVLIIEDEHWLAEVFAEALHNADMQPHIVSHAHAAMAFIETSIPEVIIADMLLTGSTILPLLHELQTHADTKHIPVVLCTNVADTLTPEALKQYGIRRVLDKTTMMPDDVVAAVRSVSL